MAADADAVIIGSGPNGLVGALTLARAGRKVIVLEAASEPGGGTRTEELTLPGFRHDVCSAIHPLALASPALRDLDLASHGVEWIYPDAAFAHPLDNGRAGIVERSLKDTAARLGPVDGLAYTRLMRPMVEAGFGLTDGLLSPLSIPKHPMSMAQFGINAIRSADALVKRFKTDEARGIIAGAAAHSMLSLNSVSTAGFGLMLTSLAHSVGWPMARGGSAAISGALVSMIEAAGGEVRCNVEVKSLRELPSAPIVLADLTPRQLVSIAGDQLPASYARALSRYRYGPGVFKLDWALDGPVPWTNADVARAATVHLGGTAAEVAASEAAVAAGRHAERPYVLLVQHSSFDSSRAPQGQHTLWAYCHVPNGSTVDMTDAVERQIERFAPGFRDRVIARHSFTTQQMQAHNANYVGGDINGGSGDIRQFVSRPRLSLSPWATPVKGLFLCSSSTPPGGGVHGMGGRAAAQLALRRS